MRLHAKILLMMLAITIGSSAIVSWIVTISVSSYETRRADQQIAVAIDHYLHHLEDKHQQISRIVRVLMEGSIQRSLLQAADDSADPGSRAQLKEEVLGREVLTELRSREGDPAFQLIVNLAGEIVVSTVTNPKASGIILADVKWPMDATIKSDNKPVIKYVLMPGGLFVAMGVPLRTQTAEAPTDAYFVGFRVDDEWIRGQLLADRKITESTEPPLSAWFVDLRNKKVLDSASSDVSDTRVGKFTGDTPLHNAARQIEVAPGGQTVDFKLAGETFQGMALNFNGEGEMPIRLILASSRDQALAPLHHLQRQILLIALLACLVAVVACRFIAGMISRPINELVAGTRRIAAAQFDHPVHIHRKDELGALADSFNKMAGGLKERDELREQRVKLERDMAVARKIQMDVLPKSIPNCAGYDMAAFSLPAEQTGGDIYDLVALALDPANPDDPPSLVLLLADATGHGIGPALSVTQVRAMLRIGVRLRAELDDVFAQINRQLCQDLGAERFVTAFLGLLDSGGHSINYHSAGQAPLLHFHGKNHRFEWLDSSMLPLGISEDPLSEGARMIKIEPGDLIVLLTDGFYECANKEGKTFGADRIAEIILQHHHRPARELLNAILEASRVFADGHPQEDDMTGVIIARLPEAES